MELNNVLFGLTHMGPERFPVSKSDILDYISRFGIAQEDQSGNNRCESALQMLQLTGHIEYVLDARRNSKYRLAKPQLRPRPDGTFLLVGARSPDSLKFLHAKTEPGISWRIDEEISLEQPDIVIIDKDSIKEMDKDVLSALGTGNIKEMMWSLPPGDLPSWEAKSMQNIQLLDGHPIIKYNDDQCKIFNPDIMRWIPVNEMTYIFDNTGPLYLLRRPTVTFDQQVIVIKDRELEFKESILPPGLDNQRWARHMLLASYGIETIKKRDGDLLETRIEAQIPTGLARALVDITGKVPQHEGSAVQFHGVKQDIAEQVIQVCTKSFVGTNLYNQTKEGKT